MVKDHFLGGLTTFLSGFWHLRQFEIVVVIWHMILTYFTGGSVWLEQSIDRLIKKIKAASSRSAVIRNVVNLR